MGHLFMFKLLVPRRPLQYPPLSLSLKKKMGIVGRYLCLWTVNLWWCRTISKFLSRFEAVTVVLMKIHVLWDGTIRVDWWRILTDVSKDSTAFIFRSRSQAPLNVLRSFETSSSYGMWSQKAWIVTSFKILVVVGQLGPNIVMLKKHSFLR